ncbi:MAG TPA: methyltransferase domain-containing protein [Candidatus Nanopelagicales bacterium]|nr:methyltransferase domain-containing protein [Candidatus Nanopelagicales bacterium]
MDEASQRVAAMFEDLAEDYDRSGVDFFQPIAAGLLERVPPAPGERWLDVGCGPGAVLLPAAAAVGPSGLVVGIDVADAMVQRARAAADDSGLSNVDVLVGDAASPPEGPFDVVVSSLVLFFLSDPAAALRAWREVLVPAGRLGVTTFGRTDDRLLDIEEVLLPYAPASMRDPRTVGDESPFLTDAGVERLVSGAGYAQVRTETFALPVRFADAEHWYAFSWSIVQRGMWRAVPPEKRALVRAEAARRFQQHADADGSATFTIDVRCTLATAPG